MLRVDDIARALADDSPPGQPLAPAFPGARPSAVLVALADGPSGAEVLLTAAVPAPAQPQGGDQLPGRPSRSR